MKKVLVVVGLLLAVSSAFAQESTTTYKALTPDNTATRVEDVQVGLTTNLTINRSSTIEAHQRQLQELTAERDKLNNAIARLQSELASIQVEAAKVKLATPPPPPAPEVEEKPVQ